MAGVSWEFPSKFNEAAGYETRRMMHILSENSRISISDLAEQLKVSRRTAKERLKKAEAELGIKYTVELDEEALGLSSPHLVMIRFYKKPDLEEVARILQSSHIPQAAFAVDGNYDMIVYANAEDTKEYVYWDKTTQQLLAKYGVLWQPSDLAYRHIGFFPLKNQLLQRLKLPEIYKKMLLLLNENSRMSFSEMSRRLEMNFNTVAYNFRRLVKAGYIKKFTVVMKNPPKVSLMTILGKYIISESFEEDSMGMRKEVSMIDDKLPLVSRCLFSAQLVGSFDFFFTGAYDNTEIGYERLVRYYKRRFKREKVKVFYGEIGKVLFGDFPIRAFDVKKEFRMIRWVPNSAPVEAVGAFEKVNI